MAFETPSWLQTTPQLWLSAIDSGTRAGIALAEQSTRASEAAASRAQRASEHASDLALQRERIDAAREEARLERDLKLAALLQRGVQQDELNDYRDAQLRLREATLSLAERRATDAAEAGDERALNALTRLDNEKERIQMERERLDMAREKAGAGDSASFSFEVPGENLMAPPLRMSGKLGSPEAMSQLRQYGGTNLPPAFQAGGPAGATAPVEDTTAVPSLFSRLLESGTHPLVRGIRGLLGGGSEPALASPSNTPVRVTTKAERDALPPGTEYVGPDGKVYTKQ
jgi:hypothetical protein